MKVLLDSVILIDHFNGIAQATEYLRQERASAAISVITRAEVMVGFEPQAALRAQPVLDLFPVLPITKEAADLAAQLRRQHRWKLPDAFQAALAQIHKLQLVTRNTRDFPPEQFPFVTVPYPSEAVRRSGQ
jgi:predicted nucleic acid-binding protein